MCAGSINASCGPISPHGSVLSSSILVGPFCPNPILFVQSWYKYQAKASSMLMLIPLPTSSWSTKFGGLVPAIDKRLHLVGTATSTSVSDVLFWLSGLNRLFKAEICFPQTAVPHMDS